MDSERGARFRVRVNGKIVSMQQFLLGSHGCQDVQKHGRILLNTLMNRRGDTHNLNRAIKRIRRFRDARQWMQFHNPKNLAMLNRN